ncbi:hypothetical protein [Bifidobacterium sp.]|uniref:hypothetical protein n=1 Tax=Bifidobacterium sp. TaxID=41200 RepID=UPI003D7C9EA4
MQDVEQMVDRLCQKALKPEEDTLAAQVRDGRIGIQEAEERIVEVYVSFLQECWRDAPLNDAAGLQELGVKVPKLVLDME